jgi:formylglycine-generating enzyme required for sulfatase activity
MGCVPGDGECDGVEKPRHEVTLTKAYDLMTTEVTIGMFRAYAAVAGRSAPAQPEWNTNDRQPALNVTWDEASAFCQSVSGRLPTEAEWERAARGGIDGAKYPWGDQAPAATIGATNGARFSAQSTATVAQFAANAFGLFDMAGNVWEWVADWHGPYSNGSVADPRGPSSGDFRVLRGGSWFFLPKLLRVSERNYHPPGSGHEFKDGYGFRCARVVSL